MIVPPHASNRPDWLDEQIRLFDPRQPIESTWLPPSSWYTEPAFYDLERSTVFKNNWLIAARADQLRAPGDYVATTIAGEPIVVVRGADGVLRAFYNVCRHHAAMVMVGEGNADNMVCPYHGWTYALDGALRSAPELGGVRDFDRECFGLAPVHVAQWAEFVFVHRGENPAPAGDGLDDLARRLEAMNSGALRFVRRLRYTIGCNWKVFVDNYLDGGYHVAHLHEGLAGQLDMATYHTEVFDRYSIQSGAGAGTAGGPGAGTAEGAGNPERHAGAALRASGSPEEAQSSRGDFAERVGDRVLYAWLYPNFMINRYGPWMDTNWVLPRGEDETEVLFDYYLDATHAGDEAFIAKSLAASDVVQQEDIDICGSVQRGLGSSSYDRGRYSVRREMGEHHFHRLLAADFRAR